MKRGRSEVDLCTPIEEFEGGLEAIQNNNRATEGIQVHNVFLGFSEKVNSD
jgi:hypothetical protein